MSVTRTAHRSSLVLFLALATFAWAAMLSTSGLLAPPTASASADQLAPEEEDGDADADDPEADEEDDVTGALQTEEEDGEDGDGAEDGLEGDDAGDGFEDDDLDDDGFEDEGDDDTPVGGVDAGFGGMATDGGTSNGLLIGTAVMLLALALGAWTVQARRTGELRA